MKILVTGFDPFDNEPTNTAYEAVKMIPDVIEGAEIIKLEIPTVFDKGAKKAIEKMFEEDVYAVLSVGQAGNRTSMSVEKVAINLIEARIPDNEGNQYFDTAIKVDGEPAYFSTLPTKAMVTEMKNNNVPAHMTYSAGTYVCNEVMYQVLYALSKANSNIKAGFMHVPFAQHQVINKPVGTPFMSIEMIAKGIEHAIEAIIHNETDLNIIMGETH